MNIVDNRELDRKDHHAEFRKVPEKTDVWYQRPFYPDMNLKVPVVGRALSHIHLYVDTRV